MEFQTESTSAPVVLTGGNAQELVTTNARRHQGNRRDGGCPPRPPPRGDRHPTDGVPIDPVMQGFDRIMDRFDQLESRMDNSDRRVDVLENPRVPDTYPRDDEFDSDDEGYAEHRESEFMRKEANPHHQQLGFRDQRQPRWDRRGGAYGARGDYRRNGDWQQEEVSDRRLVVHQPRRISSWDPPPTRGRGWRDNRRASCWDPPPRRDRVSYHQESDSRYGVKMRAPHFDGSDASNWISRVKYYFDHVRMPEEDRLHYAVMLFDPPAAEWIFNYRNNNRFVSWSEFLEDVRHRFDPQSFKNYIGPLSKLVQTGSVADYHDTLEKYLNRAVGMPDYVLLPIFIEGLKEPIQEKVEMHQPQSLAEAMAIALRLGAKEAMVEPRIATACTARPQPSHSHGATIVHRITEGYSDPSV